MSKIDILCKFKSLDNMINQYGNAIDKLTMAFYELSAVCDEMEADKYWLGDAHDSYMELYSKWKETFLRKLAGIIIFQSALSCVNDSLLSVLKERNKLINDISASSGTSPVSADSDSSDVLRVQYSQASSADYEISSSNPRFLDEMSRLLLDAKSNLKAISSSDYSEIKTVRSSIDSYCTDLENERLRYTGFGSSYYSFCTGAKNMESMLTSTIDSMFCDYLAGLKSSEIAKMVDNYAMGSLAYDLSNLGISQTDALFLMELQNLYSSEAVNEADVIALCDQYETLGANKELIKAILDAGSRAVLKEKRDKVITDAIAVYLGKTTNLSVAELTNRSALIASQISRLSKKSEVILGRMDSKYKYYPENGYYKRRLRELQNAMDLLSDEKSNVEKELSSSVKLEKWGKVLPWALIAVEVGFEGFKSRVIEGLDWDDVCQDMGDAAVAGVGGYVAGSAVTWGAATLLEYLGIGTAVAGPIGTIVGIGVGVFLTVKEPLHNFFEEATDWWDMLCW